MSWHSERDIEISFDCGGLAPKWKIASGAALGMWALLGLKAVLLDREPRAIYITVIASALILGLLITARHSDS